MVSTKYSTADGGWVASNRYYGNEKSIALVIDIMNLGAEARLYFS